MNPPMNRRRYFALLALLVLSVGLIAASATAALMAGWGEREQFRRISAICEGVVAAKPDAEAAVLAALKPRAGAADGGALLARYGYAAADFSSLPRGRVRLAALAGFSVGAALFALSFAGWRARQSRRIRALTEYLARVNAGESGELLRNREGPDSALRDEIYKTVTALRRGREAAVAARRKFADNLYNIAHQIKTPVAAIALSAGELRDRGEGACAERIDAQLERLMRFEDALLLLARVDAGALPLRRREADLFTLLTLAADNLDELLRREGVRVDIPELGAAAALVDSEWTMEALMNLMKNCAEHAPAGSAIHCAYECNPIYAQIQIWDEGPGFAPEELPRLFERFYRGPGARPGGAGIGLALAKELVELQNGTLRASNRPGGGAAFELRFYRH